MEGRIKADGRLCLDDGFAQLGPGRFAFGAGFLWQRAPPPRSVKIQNIGEWRSFVPPFRCPTVSHNRD